MRFLIVDDHPLVCSALERMLQTAFEPCDLLQAHSAAEAVRIARRRDDFDLVLLDLRLPDAEGFQGLLQLRREVPKTPILVLADPEDAPLMQTARNHGAQGYISKKSTAAEVVAAVHAVLAGKTAFAKSPRAPEESAALDSVSRMMGTLTPQQATVLHLLGEGLLNKQIAYELSISESTVKAHVSAILRKLDVSSRIQAALLAQRGALMRSSASRAGAETHHASIDR